MANKKETANLKVTLVRSTSGKNAKHQATVRCLGLKRLHHSVTLADNAGIRGMINKVYYLVKVEEV